MQNLVNMVLLGSIFYPLCAEIWLFDLCCVYVCVHMCAQRREHSWLQDSTTITERRDSAVSANAE